MDPKEHLHRQEQGLGPINNRSGRLHGRTIIASARDRAMNVGDQTLFIPTPGYFTLYETFESISFSIRPLSPQDIGPPCGTELQCIYR